MKLYCIKQLLQFRPCELNSYITRMKILKKYGKLKESDEQHLEKTFQTIFQDTTYPFTWKLWYEGQNSYTYLHIEKKVLFEYRYEKHI